MNEATEKEIRFVHEVAKDFRIVLTDEEAKRAHSVVMQRIEEEELDSEEYYYILKEYFTN